MKQLHFNAHDLQALTRIPRLTLMNAVAGFKSPNLIGTIDPDTGITNLAIFSSAVHFGSHPPLIGIITRPVDVDRKTSRHTYENIKKTEVFTLNHVHSGIIAQAHQTSAAYAEGISEFEEVGLTPHYEEGFDAPYVAESHIRIGLRLREEVAIEANKTILLIGEVEHLYLPKNALTEEFDLLLTEADTVALSGQHRYYKAEQIGQFPYARPPKTEK